jgi:hypothetical protein
VSVILTILGDIVLGCMFAGFYALGVSAGRAATRQEPENSIAMEHKHGGDAD